MGNAMNLDDFVEGVISMLCLDGNKALDDQTLERSLVEAFSKLEALDFAELRFHLNFDFKRKGCITARYGAIRAESNGYIQKNRGEWDILMNTATAERILKHSPLSKSQWEHVIFSFQKIYR